MPETPTEFFRKRSFELTFTTHTEDEVAAIYEKAVEGLPRRVQNNTRRALADGRLGSVFADLRSQDGHVIHGYGTGQDETSAGRSAVQRWKQEQGD